MTCQTQDFNRLVSMHHFSSQNSSDLEIETLSRDHPISEFIRMQNINIKEMSHEEFVERFESHMKSKNEEKRSSRPASSSSAAGNTAQQKGGDDSSDISGAQISRPFQRQTLQTIVLKFTTLSEAASEAPSFFVGTGGARIGRDPINEINVPSDARLAPVAHSFIEYANGCFYIVDCGYDFAASVRIGVGGHRKRWVMDEGAQFSAGNSIFRSRGMNENKDLVVEVIEGPMNGEVLVISRGVETSIGRASDNAICVPDRELSRRHSRIDFDRDLGAFVVSDMGSTNGTYIQLVGPYGGRQKLNLNDHILVGRTGFSVNRYDFGVSEEMGHRQTMEDACTIVQHLNMGPLCTRDLSPQSFFGVFDGHGGVEASYYLSQNLHINVADGLLAVADDLVQVLETSVWRDIGLGLDVVDIGEHKNDSNNRTGSANGARVSSREGPREGGRDVAVAAEPSNSGDTSNSVKDRLDTIVMKSLKDAFRKTDDDFIRTSSFPQHGSTATTALVLGHRLYCANVGDSRTLLCRNFKPVAMSYDHKPSREDEAKRIRDAGGFVINNRVMGELAVSRAFGDSEFKKGVQSIIGEESHSRASSGCRDRRFSDTDSHGSARGSGSESASGSAGGSRPGNGAARYGTDDIPWDHPLVIAEPDIEVTTITDHDQFLLVACDGLFDVFSGEDIVQFVRTNMAEHGDAQKCCQNLTQEAIMKRHSRDNVSVILIILNRWY